MEKHGEKQGFAMGCSVYLRVRQLYARPGFARLVIMLGLRPFVKQA